jgi:hypothetical protein
VRLKPKNKTETYAVPKRRTGRAPERCVRKPAIGLNNADVNMLREIKAIMSPRAQPSSATIAGASGETR